MNPNCDQCGKEITDKILGIACESDALLCSGKCQTDRILEIVDSPYLEVDREEN